MDEGLKALIAFHGTKYDVQNRMSITSSPPKEATEKTGLDPDGKKSRAFSAPSIALSEKLRTGQAFYTLTRIPTPGDAALDNIAYNDYLRLFFEACDQPWSAIQNANAHLISKLEQASKIHILDEDTGTDLTLRIDGRKWANSLVLKNVPGSEVFASPVRDSVNGRLIAKGKFRYEHYPVIEDITLEFKDGRVIAFDAAKSRESLASIIEADDGKGEGSRYAGEFALGTNPRLKQHLVNGLLVEKISGSFHIALGESYKYEEYDGKSVALDNKNTSASGIHWDITTMMQGRRSKMVLDEGTPHEYVIMQAGNYPDPMLRVLNEGWAALEDKPLYWQNRLANHQMTRESQPLLP